MAKAPKPRGITLDDLAEEAAEATKPTAPVEAIKALGNASGGGTGDDAVAINMFVTRADRKRLKRIAEDADTSVNRLGHRAWNLLMREMGLPELTPTAANVPSGRKR